MEKGYAAVPTPEAKLTLRESPQRAAPKTPERIWNDALSFLQAELPRQFFETWLRDAEPVHLDDNTFVLGVANKFAREQLESQHKETILRVLAMVVGHAVDVEIVVNQEVSIDEGSSQGKVNLEFPDSDPFQEIISTFKWYWAEIVDPERVVSISRYFVKYWLPILGPHFSSTVLAFKQLRYLQKIPSNRPFEVRLSDILRWHSVSRSSFYRNLEKPHPLLSWFVEEVPSIGPEYERKENGEIRQKPKQYIVNGSMPLCPPHQLAIEQLLTDFGACSDPDKTLSALESVTMIPDQELQDLLESSFSSYTEKGSQNHPLQDRSVLDIVRDFIGKNSISSPEGKMEMLADELHYRLVRPDQVVMLTWYFVQQWQKLLKSAAFWLIVYLRSLGYFDKHTNELRSTFWVNGGYYELSKKVGVHSETISKWFGQNWLSTKNSQTSYIQQFITLLEHTRGRNPDNGRSLSIKLDVQMKDPLTPDGEKRFIELVERNGHNLDELNIPSTNYLVKQDTGESEYPANRDSVKDNDPVKRDTGEDDHPVNQDSDSPVKRDTDRDDYPVKREGKKYSTNNTDTYMTKDTNTYESTTTSHINQLILPLIYQPNILDESKSGGSTNFQWNLKKMLSVNNIPPDISMELLQSGIRGRDFAAWILYAYSQEGRGIKKPGFLAANRLLEDPPILAQKRWYDLAKLGPGFVHENIRCAMDPVNEDVDQEWGRAMEKVSRERLEQLYRDLGFESELDFS
jgi:hypothetical protein